MCTHNKTKAVFNYFFMKAEEENLLLTSMKAIKLVYIAHGYHLAINDAPLIDDEVQAWKFGAVIPSLYQELKIYGKHPIKAPILKDSANVDQLDLYMYTKNIIKEMIRENDIVSEEFSDKQIELLDSVWDAYKSRTAFELSESIHKPGTPWFKMWYDNNGCIIRGMVIRDEDIKAHYKELVYGDQTA